MNQNQTDFDPANVDVEAMAKRLGIDLFVIKRALGLPIFVSGAASLAEAVALWRQPRKVREITREMIHAFSVRIGEFVEGATFDELMGFSDEWSSFPTLLYERVVKRAVELAATPADIKRFCETLPHESCVEEMALSKWAALSRAQIEAAADVDEASNAYEHAPPLDNEIQLAAKDRQNTFARARLATAQTPGEIWEAYQMTASKTETAKELEMRWVEACTTIEELSEGMLDLPGLSGGWTAARKKFDDLCLQALESAYTEQEILELYSQIPDNHDEEMRSVSMALRKLAQFFLNATV